MKRILYLLCLSIILTACNKNIETKSQMTTSQDNSFSPTSYPIISNIEMEGDAAYPIIEKNLIITNQPTALPDSYSIQGTITDILLNRPLKNMDIYLTPALGIDKDKIPNVLAGPLDDHGDIKGKTNDFGEFLFVNVPIGNYFLVVSVDQSILSKDKDAFSPLLIQVEDDKNQYFNNAFYIR